MIKKMQKQAKKVILGMSSGVDSTVAAALLKQQGYEVIGIFMHFWKEPSKDKSVENKCCSLESYQELKKICRLLKIPLYTANVEKEFKKEIVDYFLREYKNGRTPNPCVVCNREIKFKVLLKKMLEMEADYVATGHYALARKSKVKSQKLKNKEKFSYKLLAARDKEKDQSYFLYNLNQKQLAKILFPIGRYKKFEVREMAKKLKLPVFDKKESQDICFVNKDTASFLKRYLKLKKGKITDEKGNVLGEHLGLPLYTFGQRKGIAIGGSGPYYVCGKDPKKNILKVTNKKNSSVLYSSEMSTKMTNWLGKEPKLPAKILVRTRYRNKPVSAIIKSYNTKHKTYNIKFNNPQRAITPGQSAVFYKGRGEVIGGGIIHPHTN